MEGAADRIKKFLRVMVLILFAGVCYRLGYSYGFVNGQMITIHDLRADEEVVAQFEERAAAQVNASAEAETEQALSVAVNAAQ